MEPTSLQLVEDVLGERMFWKLALEPLGRRAPDPASTRAVIEAYERGACDAWLAAWLLGTIRHPDGYATALAILRSDPDPRAKVYAGPALAKLRGDDALADLAAVLEDPGFSRSTHEGAAYGLVPIADPRALDVLLAAVDATRVRTSTAGSVVSDRPLEPARLLGWLRGSCPRRRAVAAWALFYRSAMDIERTIPDELCGALHVELDRGGLPFTAEQKAMLRQRLPRPPAPPQRPPAPLPAARIVKRRRRT